MQESFKLYAEYVEHVELLTNAEAGMLFKCILAKANDMDISVDIPSSVKMAFSFIAMRMDRDEKAYRDKCEKNRTNGANGGRPKKAVSEETERLKTETEKTERFFEKPNNNQEETERLLREKENEEKEKKEKNQKKDKEKEVKEKESLPVAAAEPAKPRILTQYTAAFSEFWSKYPRGEGKAEAFKAWQKLKPDAELIGRINTALERQKQSQQWKRDGGRYIPHASTWLNQRRWEDELKSNQTRGRPYQGNDITDDDLNRLLTMSEV